MIVTMDEPSILPPQKITGEHGRLEYADGRSVDCKFEIVQEPSGDLWVVCEHEQGGWVFAEAMGGPSPIRLTGITADGLRFSAEGQFVQLPDLEDDSPIERGVRVRYHTNGPGVQFTRERLPDEGPISVRFALVNLDFSGSVVTEYHDSDGFRASRDTLPLTLSGRPVTLVQTKNHARVVQKLHVTRGVAVTALALTTVERSGEIETLKFDIGRLCALLSLATGTKVVWVSFEARLPDGEACRRDLGSSASRPFRPFALIDARSPQQLLNFIESAFSGYLARESEYQLGRVIDARLDAISGGFLETRTLMAGVLAEFISSRYCAIHKKAAGSIGERLGLAVQSLCPDVRGKDIRKLVKSRDHLAHEMDFRPADKRADYLLSMHVVNRLILGLLGYSGPYIDCRTWQTVMPANGDPPLVSTGGMARRHRENHRPHRPYRPADGVAVQAVHVFLYSFQHCDCEMRRE